MFELKTLHQPMFEFCSAGNLINDAGFLHGDRCLTTFVLLIGNEGQLYIAQDSHVHVLEKGTYLLLFPGLRHFGVRPSEGRLNYYWCHFYISEKCPYTLEAEDHYHCMKMVGEEPFSLPELSKCLSYEKTCLLFRQLIDISRAPGAQRIKDLTITLILSDLAYNYSLLKRGIEQKHNNRTIINKIVDFIEHNYAQPIGIQMISERFHYNGSYLSMLFKKCMGIPLVTYINRTRIDAAKSLLLNSSNPISYVASQVGFNDEKYFMRVFKAVEGITPTRFRNLYSYTHINSQ